MPPPQNIVDRELTRFGRVIKYEEHNGIGIMVTDNGSYYKNGALYMVWTFNVKEIESLSKEELNNPCYVLTASACHTVNTETHFRTAWKKEFKRAVERAQNSAR